MNSRLTTFGRRVVITSAVFGLTTVGSAGVAAADPIGFSPAGKVVAKAPMAVSVTFKEPLRAGGARMRIFTQDGDVGTGAVTTSRKTLRRALRAGAPQGDYRVEWQAVTAKGRKMSGTFSFFAASGNGEAGEVERTSPVPSPPTQPPTKPPTEPATQSPTPPATQSPTTQPPATPEWIAGSEPMWTPQPTATSTGGAVTASKSEGSGGSGGDRGVSNGFTVVPLTVGGLLVLAAGIVSLINRPRLRD
jgi:methionine-rich copper-binding protein CopC